MPEPKNFTFSHTELAELLVQKLDIHEGFWGIYLEFGLGAGNVPASSDTSVFVPAAITFVNKVGIQRFEAPSNLTVDAAAVNPKSSQAKKKRVKG